MNLTSKSKINLSGAIDWIASNDNEGDNESIEELEGYISVLLVADLFEVDPIQIAEAVWRRRNNPV